MLEIFLWEDDLDILDPIFSGKFFVHPQPDDDVLDIFQKELKQSFEILLNRVIEVEVNYYPPLRDV